jgi:hypothetical protein
MNEDKKEAGIHRSNNDVKMLLVDKFLVLLAGNHPERFRPVVLTDEKLKATCGSWEIPSSDRPSLFVVVAKLSTSLLHGTGRYVAASPNHPTSGPTSSLCEPGRFLYPVL